MTRTQHEEKLNASGAKINAELTIFATTVLKPLFEEHAALLKAARDTCPEARMVDTPWGWVAATQFDARDMERVGATLRGEIESGRASNKVI